MPFWRVTNILSGRYLAAIYVRANITFKVVSSDWLSKTDSIVPKRNASFMQFTSFKKSTVFDLWWKKTCFMFVTTLHNEMTSIAYSYRVTLDRYHSLPLHACFEDTCPISIRDMGVFVGNNHPYQKLQSNLPAYILLDRKVSPHPLTSCMCLARATWSVLENLLLLRTNIPDNGILSAVSTVGCTHCL